MPLLSPADRAFLDVLSRLAYCNPFHPERIELERAALGDEFVPEDHIAWSRTAATATVERPNVAQLTARADRLAEQMRAKLADGHQADAQDQGLYEDLVSYVLYYRWVATMTPACLTGHKTAIATIWRSFVDDHARFYGALPGAAVDRAAAAHLFACLHQLRRAFRHIFDCILGESLPAARLRGMVWQSIFTHDMRRYRRGLYARMADLSTLVTGPSGTGKELVARAVSLSQYVAFDQQSESLVGKPDGGFLPINLSAMSPTLIESELFGHSRGAFTGATAERAGWLESCPAHGAVFLDEIGELDAGIQVKLLRVVQSRVYCRLGETSERPFVGKIIAATNRDLSEEMHAGRFREDLYYRLCSDRIQTPSLREQVADRPQALGSLIGLIADRVAGEDAASLAEEVGDWVASHLPPGYAWPGNIRELEQCVRSVMVRGDYTPCPAPPRAAGPLPAWLEGVESAELTADELVRRYTTAAYAQLGGYEATARRLGLDRRTVKAKVDAALLAELR